MKNITRQYQDLLEGKMSRSNFVRNCRQEFPQYISPVTSIDDAIKILKSKRIISEMIDFQDDSDISGDPMKKGYDDNYDGYGLEDCPFKSGSTEAKMWKDGWMEAETEKQIEHDEETYKRETGGYADAMLNEAAEKPEGKYKEITGKQQYERFKDLDNVNFQIFLKALSFEIGQQENFDDKMLPALMQKIAKKMTKDPMAYRELIIANTVEISKTDEALKMKEVKTDNFVDEANGMKEIKGQEKYKADSAPKSENRKGKPEGVKEMGVTPKKAKGITGVMDMPGKETVLDELKESLKRSLKEDTHYKYNVGMKIDTPKGEGEVKEINGGTLTVEMQDGNQMDFQINTIDHIAEKKKEAEEKANENFRPGVDLGRSFDKFKSQLSDEDAFEDMMKDYDWYAEMSDDSRKWDDQQAMERKLKMLAQNIGAETAAQIWNRYAPQNRKVNAKYFSMREDKYSKLKEYLKKMIKKEAVKFKAGGETMFTSNAEAPSKEAELKKAGVKYIKTSAN
jgi:hypothetical protein